MDHCVRVKTKYENIIICSAHSSTSLRLPHPVLVRLLRARGLTRFAVPLQVFATIVARLRIGPHATLLTNQAQIQVPQASDVLWYPALLRGQ